MSDDEVIDEVHGQIFDIVENADYPITDPMQLLPALPDGLNTRIEIGDRTMGVIELSREIPQGTFEWPYESAEELADDIVQELQERDAI